MPANRAALQVSVCNQMRVCLLPAKLSNLLFSDLAGVVDSVLSFLVRVVQLVKRLLVFHAMSLRCPPVCHGRNLRSKQDVFDVIAVNVTGVNRRGC
jgi:hypothetical protein